MCAADPSMLAVAEAMRIRQFEDRCSLESCYNTNDIHLLSIGTGRAQFLLSPPGSDAGVLFWASRVADVMGVSQVQGIHLHLNFLLDERNRQVNFQTKEGFGLADVLRIPELFRIGACRREI